MRVFKEELTITTTPLNNEQKEIVISQLEKWNIVRDIFTKKIQVSPTHVCGAHGFGKGASWEPSDICSACEEDRLDRENVCHWVADGSIADESLEKQWNRHLKECSKSHERSTT